MKPRMFIASSVERLDLAYAAQEELEHSAEVTVWSQGVFEPSRTAMNSLIDTVGESDFGLFILAPDDVASMRDTKKQVVRDNVVFELGMFIGRLGAERCFLIVPRGVSDLHLPTDLLGLSPVTYDPDRQDENLRAALGPACNSVRRAIIKLGPVKPKEADQDEVPAVVLPPSAFPLTSDPEDCLALIQSWMGGRSASDNRRAIRYDEVDSELGLEPGSAKVFIEQAASKYRYVPERKGKDFILFKQNPLPVRARSHWM